MVRRTRAEEFLVRQIAQELSNGKTRSKNVLKRDSEVILNVLSDIEGPPLNGSRQTIRRGAMLARLYVRLVGLLEDNCAVKSGRLSGSMMLVLMQDLVSFICVSRGSFDAKTVFSEIKRLLALSEQEFDDELSKFVCGWFKQWRERAKTTKKRLVDYGPEENEVYYDLDDKVSADIYEAALTTLVAHNFLCGTIPTAFYVLSCALQDSNPPKTMKGKVRLLQQVCKIAREVVEGQSVHFEFGIYK